MSQITSVIEAFMILRIVLLLAVCATLPACGGTDWNKVYSGMSNDGKFRH